MDTAAIGITEGVDTTKMGRGSASGCTVRDTKEPQQIAVPLDNTAHMPSSSRLAQAICLMVTPRAKTPGGKGADRGPSTGFRPKHSTWFRSLFRPPVRKVHGIKGKQTVQAGHT